MTFHMNSTFFYSTFFTVTFLVGVVDGLIGLNEDAAPVFRHQNPGFLPLSEGRALCHHRDVGGPVFGIFLEVCQPCPIQLETEQKINLAAPFE